MVKDMTDMFGYFILKGMLYHLAPIQWSVNSFYSTNLQLLVMFILY